MTVKAINEKGAEKIIINRRANGNSDEDIYYELINHLGNVLATVSDQKIPVLSSGVIDHYLADVNSISVYYPFGSPMAGRNYNIL